MKVTPDGVVKLLDFGLAKAFTPESGEAPAEARAADSPTLTMGATVAGIILGTAAYMAPEQAKGKRVDKRVDIWSWGVVFCELLTGERMFQGEDIADTLAAVIHKQPNLGIVPAKVRRLLGECLQKDPKLRLRDIGDATRLLDKPGQPKTSAALPSRVSWAVAAFFAVAAAGLSWIAWRATRPVERPLIQLSAELGQDATPRQSAFGSSTAVSPDGSVIAAIVRGADGQTRLGTRRLDQSQITLLPGTEGAIAPFFSPTGKWIAFSAVDQIRKISLEGSTPVKICDACRGGSWGDDNSIVTMPGVGTGIARVSSDGGVPTLITQLDTSKQEFGHRWPQTLPGNQAVLFTAYSRDRDYDDSEIDVVSLKSGLRKTIYRGGTYARYLPSGHVVFIHQNTLFAAPFDLKRLELSGAPQPVVESVRNGADEGADFDFSNNGTFVYLSIEGAQRRSIFWLTGEGRTQALESAAGFYAEPRFSPDGKYLAYSLDDGQGHTEIWVRDLARDTPRLLTSLPGRNTTPVWTLDGGIIFLSSDPAAPGLYWVPGDGSSKPQHLTSPESLNRPGAVRPDGKWLAAHRPAEAPGTGGAIWMTPIEGDPGHPKLGKSKLFMNSAILPAFSPDGRWVAYFSQVPGQSGVWVRPFQGPGGPWLVDGDGGYPVWPQTGSKLFYVSRSTGRMMATGYSVNGDSFVPDKPQAWSERRLLPSLSPVTQTYDVEADGKRFAVVLYEDGTAQEKPITHVTFLLNFFEYLRQHVPPTK